MERERFQVTSAPDVEQACRYVRSLARSLLYNAVDAEAVTLAARELATNLVRYALGGAIVVSRVHGARGEGIQLESLDRGPGIADVARAMQDGFSTGRGMGSGLPSVRRLMDEFEIATAPTGTSIVARKWSRRAS